MKSFGIFGMAVMWMVTGAVIASSVWGGFEPPVVGLGAALGAAFGVAHGGLVLNRSSRAAQRYTGEFSLIMSLYVVILFASIWARDLVPESPWLVALALAPVVPLVLLLWPVMRCVRGLDELQQKFQFEAVVIAFIITIFTCLTLGFLQSFGILPADKPLLIFVGPFAIGVWGLSQPFVRARYA